MTENGSNNVNHSTANLDPLSTEDFSNKAVMKKVMSEATQHPTTLISAAVAILGGAYFALLNPNETSFYVAVGGGLISLLSFVYHYFIRGEEVAVTYRKEMLEKRRNLKDRQSFDIEAECRDAGFVRGEEAARELLVVYLRLKNFLKEKYQQRQSAFCQTQLSLVEDAYDQGVSLLRKAISLYKAIDGIEKEKLVQESIAWENEIEKLKKDAPQEGNSATLMLEALQKRIGSHKRRLELYEKRQETLREVLAQCEIIEAKMDSIYLELTDLLGVNHQIKHQNVIEQMEQTVKAARRAEDRIRGIEMGDQFDDSIYARPKNEE